MKKQFLCLLLLIVLTLSVSAVEDSFLGFFAQKKAVSLQVVCDNCTFVNLTSVVFPNSSYAVLGQFSMTKNGTNYNRTFTQANASGTYYYTTCGDLDGFTTCDTASFIINSNGVELTTERSLIYVVIFFILVFFFVLTLFGINKLPSKNDRDDEGKIVKISWLKYLRITFWMFEWIFLLAMFFLAGNLAEAYLGEQLFANFLLMLFRIGMALSLPLFLFYSIWIIVNAIQDKEFRKYYERGFFPENRF